MKKVILIVLLGGIFSFCFSQTELPVFVKPEYNKIIYPGDSTQMMKFFRKVDELQLNRRKKVSIIHYGGSHVEGGHWDEVFQDNLQNNITKFDGGGVWTFPFKLAEANTPPFYKTFTSGKWKRCRPAIGKEDCSVYGVNGITVNTNERYNDFAIALQENFHHKYFKTIKVYHSFNPAYTFYIDYNSGLKYKHTDVRREGYSLYEFEDNIDSVSFKVEKIDTLSTTEFTLYGFSLETDDPGFYYACMGFNGASCQSFIESQLLVPQLRSLNPDLVIFSIGVNDTHGPNFTKGYMVSHYDSLVAMVKRAAPECAILFTTVTDNYIKVRKPRRRSVYVANPKTLAAYDAILELSRKHNAGYWDMFNVMGGFKSMALWHKAGLASKDKVHFSTGGYHIMGNLMYQAFVQSYYANSVLKKK